MPTPRVVQAIVSQRTSLVVDWREAKRLVLLTLSSAPNDRVVVHGRDPVSGEQRSSELSIAEILGPPDGFVPPA